MAMLGIAGIVLIIAAFQIGVPADLQTDYVHSGQACLVLGVALLTWALLSVFPRLIELGILALGVAVAVIIGVYERDVLGLAGGAAIMAVSCWNFWKRRA